MAKTFDVSFNNIIFDGDFKKLPHHKDIYLFRLSRNNNGVVESEIIYVGVADGCDGLAGRINENHEHLNEARELLNKKNRQDQKFYLSIAYSDENLNNNAYLKRIEASLIFALQPLLNTDGKESFNYQTTTINLKGIKLSGFNHKQIKKHYLDSLVIINK